MTRVLVIGLWICVATLGSTFGGFYWKTRSIMVSESSEPADKLEVKKVKPITVPIIIGGQLKGYVSAEFSYVMESAGKRKALAPDTYIMDEAFRRIYAENTLDFRNIQKVDLDALTSEITQQVNNRLGASVVRETLVKSFTFVPMDEMPR